MEPEGLLLKESCCSASDVCRAMFKILRFETQGRSSIVAETYLCESIKDLPMLRLNKINDGRSALLGHRASVFQLSSWAQRLQAPEPDRFLDPQLLKG